MDQLTDDELRAELRLATHMADISSSAGEADAEALYASIVRAVQFEQRRRTGA